jgi:hypothetical protein
MCAFACHAEIYLLSTGPITDGAPKPLQSSDLSISWRALNALEHHKNHAAVA